MNYLIFKARLTAGNGSEILSRIAAESIEEAKEQIKEKLNKNPFYTVIVDESGKEVYNQHLQLGYGFIKNHL